MPSMKGSHAFYREIFCLQGFWILTSVDMIWPLTATKNNRLLPLNMIYPSTKYEKYPSVLSWDIVFRNQALKTHTHTHAYTPSWPHSTLFAFGIKHGTMYDCPRDTTGSQCEAGWCFFNALDSGVSNLGRLNPNFVLVPHTGLALSDTFKAT